MAAPMLDLSDQAVTVDEARKRLANIGRSTFYRIEFFKHRKIRMSTGRVGILLSDIAKYLELQSKKAKGRR